jgi:hypothetical protein
LRLGENQALIQRHRVRKDPLDLLKVTPGAIVVHDPHAGFGDDRRSARQVVIVLIIEPWSVFSMGITRPEPYFSQGRGIRLQTAGRQNLNAFPNSLRAASSQMR